MKRRPLLVANWKMYKTVEASKSFARTLSQSLQEWWNSERVELVIAPTALALAAMRRQLGDFGVQLGAQNLELGTEAALTGGLSGYLLHEAGADWAIVGHSERRQHFGETDAMVADKFEAAAAAGLLPIVCVGETEAERDQGRTEAVVLEQLERILEKPFANGLTIAYEPVWAIGSGRVAKTEEANQISLRIRTLVAQAWPENAESVRILYGGSVNPDNLHGFLAQSAIDGALIGGASLSADGLTAMIRVAETAKP